MNSLILKVWQRTNGRRVVLIATAISIVALGLFLFLASLGDSDLPPYQPDTLAERIGKLVSSVALWPLVAAAFALGRDPHVMFWLPLAFLGGLFWAVIIEFICIAKNARKGVTH